MNDFNHEALKLFAYQYQNNKDYRSFCDLNGKNPSNVLFWKEIPAVPTQAFRELELRSFPKSAVRRIFRTSGTTGAKRGQHFFRTLKYYEAAIKPSFEKYLLPDCKKLRYFFLITSPLNKKDSSLCHMMGVVNRFYAKGKGRFYVRNERLSAEQLYQGLAVSKQAVMILATAFSLKAFLDYLKANRLKLSLKKGSRLMETGGFKGRTQEISKKALYNLCSKYLGIPRTHCVSEYGMTELSSQFYDSRLYNFVHKKKQKPVFEAPEWVRTLIIDPATGREASHGKIGILRHFDLVNRDSALAIQTEDRGRAVGNGFELLGRAPKSELRGCSLGYEQLR